MTKPTASPYGGTRLISSASQYKGAGGGLLRREGAEAERSRIVALLRNPPDEIIGTLIRTHCASTFSGCEWPACLPDPDYVCCADEPEGMRVACAALADLIESQQQGGGENG